MRRLQWFDRYLKGNKCDEDRPAVRVDRPERPVAQEPGRLSAEARAPPQGLRRRHRAGDARGNPGDRRPRARPPRSGCPDQGGHPGPGRRGDRRRTHPSLQLHRDRRIDPARRQGPHLRPDRRQGAKRRRRQPGDADPDQLRRRGARGARISLTRIANVAPPEGFELQLISQSSLFDIQRAAGAVAISDLEARLPITKPRKR